MNRVASRNDQIYRQWTELLRPYFSEELELHADLLALSHSHRQEHQGSGAECEVWPSPPYRTPLWYRVRELRAPRRVLEIGTGIGYGAAVIASATGAQVDTLEMDRTHAQIAIVQLRKRGLARLVEVHVGRWQELVPPLAGKYDVVFVDAGDVPRDQTFRLLAADGVWVDKRRFGESISRLSAWISQGGVDVVESEVRSRYRDAVADALVAP